MTRRAVEVNPDTLPDAVVRACRGVARPVILMDGGSGAGKTSLAQSIVERWPSIDHGAAAQQGLLLVSLDDTYPGWTGLRAGSEAVPGIVTTDHPGYWRWDWVHDRRASRVDLDPSRPLLVEGCGALTRESALLATVRIWVEAPPDQRKHRALARDAGGFDPYWDLWAEQEAEHWARNRPWLLADLICRT